MCIRDRPIVALLFERGSFDKNDTLMTAKALSIYAIGLWAISSYSIIVRAFLAKKDTKTPAIISLISLIATFLISVLLMGDIGESNNLLSRGISSLQEKIGVFSFGHLALAMAGAISNFISFFVLFYFLTKKGLEFEIKPFIYYLIKVIFASSSIFFSILLVKALGLNLVFTVILSVFIAILSYLLASKTLGITETNDILKLLSRSSCLLYTSPSPRDATLSRMPSSA